MCKLLKETISNWVCSVRKSGFNRKRNEISCERQRKINKNWIWIVFVLRIFICPHLMRRRETRQATSWSVVLIQSKIAIHIIPKMFIYFLSISISSIFRVRRETVGVEDSVFVVAAFFRSLKIHEFKWMKTLKWKIAGFDFVWQIWKRGCKLKCDNV